MTKIKVSQQQIATRAGVSQTVVSRVLNGRPVRVSEKTREKILSQAQDLKYNNRYVTNTGPDLIAFVVHSNQWDNLLPIARGMKKALAGTNTLIVHQEFTEDAPQALAENVKGCVSLSSSAATAVESVKKLQKKVPTVLILDDDKTRRVDSVCPDPLPAYRTIIEELWAKGHRHFGYFGIQSMIPQLAKRATGVEEALIGLDHPRPDQNHIFLPHRKEAVDSDTRRLVGEYLDLLEKSTPRPTALFFEIELYAEFFKETAIRRSYKIPDDFTLISHFNTIKPTPDIQKILVPWEDMGYIAVKALEWRMANPDMPTVMHHVPHSRIE